MGFVLLTGTYCSAWPMFDTVTRKGVEREKYGQSTELCLHDIKSRTAPSPSFTTIWKRLMEELSPSQLLYTALMSLMTFPWVTSCPLQSHFCLSITSQSISGPIEEVIWNPHVITDGEEVKPIVISTNVFVENF